MLNGMLEISNIMLLDGHLHQIHNFQDMAQVSQIQEQAKLLQQILFKNLMQLKEVIHIENYGDIQKIMTL